MDGKKRYDKLAQFPNSSNESQAENIVGKEN
jgi:hypothetical protein